MSLPYENSSSGTRALDDIQKMLRAFGCQQFGWGEDVTTGEVFVQFNHRGRIVRLTATAKGYAAAWLKEHPYTHRMRCTRAQHEQQALAIGSVAVYSILRDWVKGQITAIEIGAMTFEAAFLAHIMIDSERRVIDAVQSQKLLPAATEK